MTFSTCLLVAAVCVLPSDVGMEFVASGVTARVGSYSPIRAEMDLTADAVKVAPEGLTAAKYGAIKMGEQSWLFVLDEPEGAPARLFVDTNGDGDLTNDPPTTWVGKTQGPLTMHSGESKIVLKDGQTGAINLYRFDPNDPRRPQLKNTLLYYGDFGYDVSVDLDGQTFTTMVAGIPANGAALWIDRDNNKLRSSKRETVVIGKPFNFTGTTYVLAANGGVLSLDKADSEVPLTPMPPNLAIGELAIPFEMAAIDGTAIEFPGSYQGKVVMLDFWATWCGPCIAELPNVKAAYEKWHGEGFDVLGISFDREGMADKVNEFTATNKMPWHQLYEGKYWGTTIGETYDVSSIPFVLLVDGDTGKILATTRQLRGPGLTELIGKVLAEKKANN